MNYSIIVKDQVVVSTNSYGDLIIILRDFIGGDYRVVQELPNRLEIIKQVLAKIDEDLGNEG